MANERILIVDDNLDLLSLCSNILQADGFSVSRASRGEDALTVLGDGGFDLLLTDIHLPGLTGLEVAGKLRAHGLDLTVIAMTGYGSMDIAIQALTLGVDEFIVKPFTADHLRHIIARGLEKSRLRRENARLKALLPLFENTRAFVGASTREELHAHIVDAVAKTIHADAVALLELDSEAGTLTLVAAHGDEVQSHVGESTSVESAGARRLAELSHVQSWKGGQEIELPFNLAVPPGVAVIGAPLSSREKQLGFLLALGRGLYSQSDVEALAIVAGQAAVALENGQLIMEISRAYHQLRELDRLKSEFINIAAHELRTPLSVLMGYALMLRDELTGSQREQIEYVAANAERLRRVSEDLLSLRYLETGEAELRLESFDVGEAVQAVVEAYRTLALEKEQPLTVSLPAAPGLITADRAMVDLMLGNLLSNAIKFSPRASPIRVEVSGDSNLLTFVVRDLGRGIPVTEQQRIFDRFYQVESSLTRQHGGLGLGLALTREMVRAHDGKIWVESEPGKGSAFYISLPRLPPSNPQNTLRSA
jgi:signal transduction histidine kinase/FixJ family two-component response regulator